ncbi:MAG: hypothetical protein ACOX9C_12695 [Kiritimatiellia bacterium]|jgi:acyl carrier protein
MKQTDQEFVEACGFAMDSEAGKAALALRRELADYGRVASRQLKTESICANTKIIDTGILHPSDSIDLAEFTVHVEDQIGAKLTDEEILALISADQGEMNVRDWIHYVLDMRK